MQYSFINKAKALNQLGFLEFLNFQAFSFLYYLLIFQLDALRKKKSWNYIYLSNICTMLWMLTFLSTLLTFHSIFCTFQFYSKWSPTMLHGKMVSCAYKQNAFWIENDSHQKREHFHHSLFTLLVQIERCRKNINNKFFSTRWKCDCVGVKTHTTTKE